MKIVINALSGKIGGGVTFLRYLVPELARQGSDHQYFLWVSEDSYVSIFKGVVLPKNVSVLKYNVNTFLMRIFNEYVILPLFLLWKRIDLLLCTANVIPFGVFCRTCVIVQNVIPFMPEFINDIRSSLLGYLSVRSIRKARRVICSSDFSLGLLKVLKNMDMSHCRRIYFGTPQAQGIRADKKKIILSVSNIYPHKNFSLLVRAFAGLSPAFREHYRLVIVGRPVGEEGKKEFDRLCLLTKEMKVDDKVIFEMAADHVENREVLARYYLSAELFVMPSLVECFSFPIFEAMSAGLPVLAADTSCFPEVVGDAGVLFSVKDPEELTRAIEKVLSDKKFAAQMGQRGIERARSFTWEKAARETLECFSELELELR